MTGWLRIKIMCQSGATCLPMGCVFQWDNIIQIQQSGSNHHLIEN